MGLVASLFRRKNKPEPTDYAVILEGITKEAEEWKEKKKSFVGRHRHAITRLFFFVCGLQLLLIIWYYFHEKPEDLFTHALHLLPLFLTPFLGYQFSKVIAFYYNKRVEHCDIQLQELTQQQKEKACEFISVVHSPHFQLQVAELKRITNFEVVQNLLNRYDPVSRRNAEAERLKTQQQKQLQLQKQHQEKHLQQQKLIAQQQQLLQQQKQQILQQQRQLQSPSTPAIGLATPSPPASESEKDSSTLRHRNVSKGGTVQQTPGRPPSTPSTTTYVMPVPQMNNPLQLPPPPEPIEVRRGLLDKIVDYLVGDGPGYSVPILCERCSAFYRSLPKDEANSIQFTCGQCGHFNCRGDPPQTPMRPQHATSTKPTEDSEQRHVGDEEAVETEKESERDKGLEEGKDGDDRTEGAILEEESKNGAMTNGGEDAPDNGKQEEGQDTATENTKDGNEGNLGEAGRL